MQSSGRGSLRELVRIETVSLNIFLNTFIWREWVSLWSADGKCTLTCCAKKLFYVSKYNRRKCGRLLWVWAELKCVWWSTVNLSCWYQTGGTDPQRALIICLVVCVQMLANSITTNESIRSNMPEKKTTQIWSEPPASVSKFTQQIRCWGKSETVQHGRTTKVRQ